MFPEKRGEGEGLLIPLVLRDYCESAALRVARCAWNGSSWTPEQRSCELQLVVEEVRRNWLCEAEARGGRAGRDCYRKCGWNCCVSVDAHGAADDVEVDGWISLGYALDLNVDSDRAA